MGTPRGVATSRVASPSLFTLLQALEFPPAEDWALTRKLTVPGFTSRKCGFSPWWGRDRK